MTVNISCVLWYPELEGDQRELWTEELKNLSIKYFKNKSYCVEVEEFDIFWASPPPRWIYFYKQHRPAYTIDKIVQPPHTMKGCPPIRLQKYLTIDILVDYDEYVKQTTKMGGWNVIGKAVMAYLREMKYPVALRKVFDRERFNHDMEEFFRSIGCSLE